MGRTRLTVWCCGAIAALSASVSAQVVSGCGTVVRGVTCNLFSFDEGGAYVAFIPGAQLGDRFHVTGTVDPDCITFCQQGACLTDITVTECEPTGPSFDQCGTVVAGFPCHLFHADDGSLLIVDFPEGTSPGDRLRVQGVGPYPCASVCNQGVPCVDVSDLLECEDHPPCAADFNRDSVAGVQDVYDFLTAWQNSDPRADINHADGITVQDIYDFLGLWLNGCS